MVEDGVDVNVVVDGMLADLTALENTWIGILNMVRLEDQEEAYWTKLMERRVPGRFFMQTRSSRLRVSGQRITNRPSGWQQGIFPESVRFGDKEGEMLQVRILQGFRGRLHSGIPHVYAMTKVWRTEIFARLPC